MTERKKILFIGTPYMDLYKDILNCMESLGYNVDFIPEGKYLQDPNNIRCYKGIKKWLFIHPKKFKKFLEKKWQKTLASLNFNKTYDILFILDGQSIHPCVFDILKQRNTKLYAVNYLFDTTSGVYRFDLNFKYFNKVFSFDKSEVKQYGLHFLPIYWKSAEKELTNKYDLFGLGRYSSERYKLFSTLQEIGEERKLNYILKLGTDQKDFSFFARIKWNLWKFLGRTNRRIPPNFRKSPLNTFENIPPKFFRQLIAESRIIVDTSAPHQDGLTARFMWALGAQKKIITTNQSVSEYSFFSPEQIFIVKNIDTLKQNDNFTRFLEDSYVMPKEIVENINKYELSNWLKLILNEAP